MKVYVLVAHRFEKDFEIKHVFRTRKNALAVANGLATEYAKSRHTGYSVEADANSYNVMFCGETVCWLEVVTRELHD